MPGLSCRVYSSLLNAAMRCVPETGSITWRNRWLSTWPGPRGSFLPGSPFPCRLSSSLQQPSSTTKRMRGKIQHFGYTMEDDSRSKFSKENLAFQNVSLRRSSGTHHAQITEDPAKGKSFLVFPTFPTLSFTLLLTDTCSSLDHCLLLRLPLGCPLTPGYVSSSFGDFSLLGALPALRSKLAQNPLPRCCLPAFPWAYACHTPCLFTHSSNIAKSPPSNNNSSKLPKVCVLL